MKGRLTFALAGWTLLCLSLCVYGYLFNNRQKNLDAAFAEECILSGKISKRVKKQTLRLLKRKDAVGWEILS